MSATTTPNTASRASRLRRWWRGVRLLGLLRVAIYVVVVSLVLGALAARSAWGDLKETSLVLGRELAQFGDVLGQSNRVRINGETVYVSSALTDQPVATLLDRFERACREHSGGLVEEFARLPEAVQEERAEKLPGRGSSGVMRHGNDDEGVVACLAQEGQEGAAGLKRRLEQFVSTGDLAVVGNLRYVYAKRTDKGRTHVLAAWTDGSLRVFNIVPMDGAEPPGTDPPQVPRPGGATRLLSAEVEGAPHGVHIYDVAQRSEQVLRDYDEQMPKQGWTPIPVVALKQPMMRAFQRPGVELMIMAHPQGDRTFVSLVETVAR